MELQSLLVPPLIIGFAPMIYFLKYVIDVRRTDQVCLLLCR